MSGFLSIPKDSTSKHQAVSIWELQKLLTPMHRFRKSKQKTCRERPHFKAILAFVHRNRFAVASQIQRRFSKYLPSDRTTRRHLAEMEALGFLAVVETSNVSPLWPKVYFVTGRGLKWLRQALSDQGREWKGSLQDRRRSNGSSAQHVLHELLTTEFLLKVWETGQASNELEILTTERRSLVKHDAFKLIVAGRLTRLQPDGMFLYLQRGKGLMVNFVEMDLCTMSIKQMEAKFRRYHLWAESLPANNYLKTLYEQHGAACPRAAFRILIVVASHNAASEQKRIKHILKIARKCSSAIRCRVWVTTASRFHNTQPTPFFSDLLWRRDSDSDAPA